MNEINTMRQIAGLSIDWASEVEDQIEVIEEDYDNHEYKSVIVAIKSVIAKLNLLAKNASDPDLSHIYHSDSLSYSRMLGAVVDNDRNGAKRIYRNMDTGARDHVSSSQYIKLKRDQKITLSYLNESITYQDDFPSSHASSTNPVNVVNDSTSETVWDDDVNYNKLSSVVAELKGAEKIETSSMTDESTSTETKNLTLTVIFNLQQLQKLISAKTEEDMKSAQMLLSSLMGPILFRIPQAARNYIFNAGESKSIKQTNIPIDVNK